MESYARAHGPSKPNKKAPVQAPALAAGTQRSFGYTVNDSPQPQVAFAFGLEKTNPLPFKPVV